MPPAERPHQETQRILSEASAKHDAVLVAFSGGKDSLAVLDLCSRAFKRVEGFCMVFVPGMRCVAAQLDYARERWGITIHEYPHWLASKCLTEGIYCWGPGNEHCQAEFWDAHGLTQPDVFALAVHETGIPCIATGQRRSDYMFRASNAKKGRRAFDTLLPVVGWNKFDVLAYLRAQQIPLPEAAHGKQTTGIDLSTPSLCWLHDTFHDDFEKLEEVFPFAGAAVARRDWYGVE